MEADAPLFVFSVSGAVGIVGVVLPRLGDAEFGLGSAVLDCVFSDIDNISAINSHTIRICGLVAAVILNIGAAYIGFKETILVFYEIVTPAGTCRQIHESNLPLVGMLEGSSIGVVTELCTEFACCVIPADTVGGNLQFDFYFGVGYIVVEVYPTLGAGIACVEVVGDLIAANALLVGVRPSFVNGINPFLAGGCMAVKMLNRETPFVASYVIGNSDFIVKNLTGNIGIFSKSNLCGLAVLKNDGCNLLAGDCIGLAVEGKSNTVGSGAKLVGVVFPDFYTLIVSLGQTGVAVGNAHITGIIFIGGLCLLIEYKGGRIPGTVVLAADNGRPVINVVLLRVQFSFLADEHDRIAVILVGVVALYQVLRNIVYVLVSVGSIDQLLFKLLDDTLFGLFAGESYGAHKLRCGIAACKVYLIEAVEFVGNSAGVQVLKAFCSFLNGLAVIEPVLAYRNRAMVSDGGVVGIYNSIAVDRAFEVFIGYIYAALAVGNNLDDGILIHLTEAIILGQGLTVERGVKTGHFNPDVKGGIRPIAIHIVNDLVRSNQAAIVFIDAVPVELKIVFLIGALVADNGSSAEAVCITGTDSVFGLVGSCVAVELEAEQRQILNGEAVGNLLPYLVADNVDVVLELDNKGVLLKQNVIGLGVGAGIIADDVAFGNMVDYIFPINLTYRAVGIFQICLIIADILAFCILRGNIVKYLAVGMGMDGGIVVNLVAVLVVLIKAAEGIAPPVLGLLLVILAAPQVLDKVISDYLGSGDVAVFIIGVLSLVKGEEHVGTLGIIDTVIIQPEQVEADIGSVLEGIGKGLACNNLAVVANYRVSAHCAGGYCISTLVVRVSALEIFLNTVMENSTLLVIERQVIEAYLTYVILSIDNLFAGNIYTA